MVDLPTRPDVHLPSMSRLRRVVVALGIALVGLVPLSTQAHAASGYSIRLYDPDLYARQVDNRTCTAASVAMMLQLIADARVRIPVTANGWYTPPASSTSWVESSVGQIAILRYEQYNDTLNNASQRGSDARGWAIALTELSRYTGNQTDYGHLAFPTAMSAMRYAAQQMAITRMPVGIAAMAGRHAIVMTGFSATADPSKTSAYTLTSISYSDPYGDRDETVTPAEFDDYPLFTRYKELDATPWFDEYWYDHWVIVAPAA